MKENLILYANLIELKVQCWILSIIRQIAFVFKERTRWVKERQNKLASKVPYSGRCWKKKTQNEPFYIWNCQLKFSQQPYFKGHILSIFFRRYNKKLEKSNFCKVTHLIRDREPRSHTVWLCLTPKLLLGFCCRPDPPETVSSWSSFILWYWILRNTPHPNTHHGTT